MLHVACTSIGPYKLLKEGADFTHTRLKHLNVIGASRSEPHSTEFYAFRGIYIIGASAAKPHMDDTSGIFHILSLGERSEPHMGDTSGIFHILLLLYIYYRTYVGVCVTPFFFFFGVRCAQYKVHAQCSFAALAPHMPCMLLVIIIIYRRTSDRSNFALRRTARKLTAHAHRCVKLKQGRPLHARPGQGRLTRLLGCYWLSGKLIGSLRTHASHTWLLAVIQH